MRRIKKLFILALVLLLATVLFSCAQSEVAKAMDEQILAIGEVTLDSREKIEAAEQAYNSLDEADRKQVRNYKVLKGIRDAYSQLKGKEVSTYIEQIGEVTLNSEHKIEAAELAYDALSQDEKQYVEKYDDLVRARNEYSQLRADKAISAIDKIGEVNVDSRVKIRAAEIAYEKLSDAEKALVSNADVLENAGRAYDAACASEVERKLAEAIKDASKIVSAETAYRGLDEAQKDMVKNYDEFIDAKIAYVISAIDNIGEVTLESAGAIGAAETAFGKLSADEKKRVTNSDNLAEAKAKLIELEEQAKQEKLDTVLKKVKKDHDEVDGITWYESTSQPRYGNTRSFVLPYIAETERTLAMRLKYDYAGNEWIFFRSAKIVTDSKEYVRSFNYSDIQRETAFGAKLFECADVAADNDDLDMLRDMASSEKVVVRLRGDDHHYDITVSESDKQAIRDILDLYELLADKEGILLMADYLR